MAMLLPMPAKPELPEVSTVVAFGYAHDGEKECPGLLLQVRDHINPVTFKPVSNAGMLSLWGMKVDPTKDQGVTEFMRAQAAAARCANEEFWNGGEPLTHDDFLYLGGPIENKRSQNSLYLLRRRVRVEDVRVRQGGMHMVPLSVFPYLLSGTALTDASHGVMRLIVDWYRYETQNFGPLDMGEVVRDIWRDLPDYPPSRVNVSEEEFKAIRNARQNHTQLTGLTKDEEALMDEVRKHNPAMLRQMVEVFRGRGGR